MIPRQAARDNRRSNLSRIFACQPVGARHLPKHLWRTRAQSEVDLVVKKGSGLRAFEIKWSLRRVSVRAFRDAYGVDVEPIGPNNPFAADVFKS